MVNSIAIGVCCEDSPHPVARPGVTRYRSWTYADDGYIASDEHNLITKPFEPTFDIGDVIGCGVDYEANMIFYYKNNEFLGK